MKVLLSLVCALFLVGFVGADDKKAGKEVTLKGTVECGKCHLKKEKSCATVVVVKESGKEVVYYFDKDSSKKFHEDICTEAKEGTVTGTVMEKDGKKWISATKVEFKEKG